jgi:hypothetical protein
VRVKEIVASEYSAAELKGLFYVFVLTSGTGEGEAEGENDDSMNRSQNQEAAHLINKLVGEHIENPGDEGGHDTDSGIGIVAAAAKVGCSGNWTNKEDHEAVTVYEKYLPRSATDPKWGLTHQC